MAQEIFEAKLRTGLYDHYTEQALRILKEDCIRQAELIERSTNEKFKGTNNRNITTDCRD